MKYLSLWQINRLIRYISMLGLAVAFAKGLLSATDIGRFETLLLLSALFTSFWVIGLCQASLALKNFVSDKPGARSLFLPFFLFGIFTFACLLLCKHYVFELFSIDNSSFQMQLYVPAIAWLAINASTLFLEYYFLIHNKKHWIYYFSNLFYITQTIVVVLCVFLINMEGVLVAIYALLFMSILRFGVAFFWILKDKSRPNILTLKKYIRLSLPLAIVAIFSGYSLHLVGLMIKWQYSLALFAVFAYGAKEFPLSLILANAFSEEVALGTKSNNLTEQANLVKKRSLKMMNWLFPLTWFLLLVSHFLFPIVFSPVFAESAFIFNTLLLALSGRLIFPQSFLMGLGYNRLLLFASIIELLFVLIAAWLLLPVFGILGGAVAIVVGAFLEKVVIAILVWKKLSVSPSKYIPFPAWLGYSIVMLGIYFAVGCFYWF